MRSHARGHQTVHIASDALHSCTKNFRFSHRLQGETQGLACSSVVLLTGPEQTNPIGSCLCKHGLQFTPPCNCPWLWALHPCSFPVRALKARLAGCSKSTLQSWAEEIPLSSEFGGESQNIRGKYECPPGEGFSSSEHFLFLTDRLSTIFILLRIISFD